MKIELEGFEAMGHNGESHQEGTGVDPIEKINDPITNIAIRLHKSYCEEEEAETLSMQE